MLKVRAVRMSGDWDDYCAYHRQQERLRNYPECVPVSHPKISVRGFVQAHSSSKVSFIP